MSLQKPRSLMELSLKSFTAALAGDHAAATALQGEIGVRMFEIQRRSHGQAVSAFEAGDWLKVRQGAKFHHGIYVSHEEVIHATTKHGVISTSLRTFAKGRQVLLVKRSAPEERDQVVSSARATKGRPYNVFMSNCEHIASFAHSGKPKSDQLEIAAFLALLAGEAVLGVALITSDDRLPPTRSRPFRGRENE